MTATFRAVERPPLGGRRPAVLGALVPALCVAAGVGSGRSLAHVGGPGRLVSTGSYGGDLLVVALAVIALGAAAIGYVTRPARRRRNEGEGPEDVDEQERSGLWAALLIVGAALVVLLGVAAAFLLFPHSAPRAPALPAGGAPSQGAAAPATTTAGARASLPPVHWWGLAVVAAVLLAGGAAAWLLRRRTGLAPDRARPEDDPLRAAVERGIDDLEAEPDPRRAVIRAYGRMEGALAGHGLGRRPSETPLEYLARTLRSRRVSRPAATRLTDLFGRAKFSHHHVDASMKHDALAALTRIRDELEGGE